MNLMIMSLIKADAFLVIVRTSASGCNFNLWYIVSFIYEVE